MKKFQILDGGMGRELKRIRAPFRQPEWSALAMIEAPDAVLAVHRSYVGAGADVITTNSYALVPFHIGDERFVRDAQNLADLAGKVARQAADESQDRKVSVAGSLPPLFGSYRPDLFDATKASRLLKPLVSGLSAHVDMWLAETLSAIAEARVVAEMLAGDDRPSWFSFTLEDGTEAAATGALLRSGEPVEDAVRFALENDAAAILFNCSQPEVMEAAVAQAVAEMQKAEKTIPVGVYANAFPPQSKQATANETVMPIRDDLDPEGYLGWVAKWLGTGAEIVGGCCGIGPEHITQIAASRRA